MADDKNTLADVAGAIARVVVPAGAALAAPGDPRLAYTIGQSVVNEFAPTADQRRSRERAQVDLETAKLNKQRVSLALTAQEADNKLIGLRERTARADASYSEGRLEVQENTLAQGEVDLENKKLIRDANQLKLDEVRKEIADKANKDMAADIWDDYSVALNRRLMSMEGVSPVANAELRLQPAMQKATGSELIRRQYGDEFFTNGGKDLSEMDIDNVNTIMAKNNLGMYLSGADGKFVTFTPDGIKEIKMDKAQFAAWVNKLNDDAIQDGTLLSARQNAQTAGQREFGRFIGDMVMRGMSEKEASALAQRIMQGAGPYRQHTWGLALTWNELMTAHRNGNAPLAAKLIDEAAELLNFEGDVVIDGAQDAEGNINPAKLTVSIPAGSSTAKALKLGSDTEEGGYHELTGRQFFEAATKDMNELMKAEVKKYDDLHADPIKDMPQHIKDSYASDWYADAGKTGFDSSVDRMIKWAKTTGAHKQLVFTESPIDGEPVLDYGAPANHAAWRRFKIATLSAQTPRNSHLVPDNLQPDPSDPTSPTPSPAAIAAGNEFFGGGGETPSAKGFKVGDDGRIPQEEIDLLEQAINSGRLGPVEQEQAMNRLSAYMKFNESAPPRSAGPTRGRTRKKAKTPPSFTPIQNLSDLLGGSKTQGAPGPSRGRTR